ncbi:MAG: sugar ABC transporter permease [Anaerolineae bacterium]|nr:sugar ABC transporter permease [Anaerolineae bacterium]
MTASQAIVVGAPRKQRPWLARLLGYQTAAEVRECLTGMAYASPWLLGLLIFVLGPILVSFYLSLSAYDVIRPPRFHGVANYVRAFTEDAQFWPSLQRTFTFALVVVPVGTTGSLLLALMLNREVRGTTVYRTLFFLPHLTPAVAMALLWGFLLHPTAGPVNYGLRLIGIQGPGWFTSRQWALPSVIMVSLWAGFGGNRMMILLAGLQGVPQELYDAADVDGANGWTRFRNVTLPMISPTLFFTLIIGVIGALKVFTLAYVATGGGPSWATWFYALNLYNWSFHYFEMGYGAALAWIFAAIVIILTLVQFRLSNRWVYYGGG